MAVSCKYDLYMRATETPALTLDLVTDPDLDHETTDVKGTLNGTSTPAVTQAFSDTITLSAGSSTLDLTSLSRGGLATADWTGLKVQMIKVYAYSTNSDTVTIADGATNGLNIFGDASGQVTIKAGGAILFYSPEGTPDVGASAKTIDITSSDADAKVDVLLVAG